MTIPVMQLHILRLLLQMIENVRGLQGDMHRNAAEWRAAAIGQTQAPATLAQWMADSAVQYQKRIAWVDALMNTSAWGRLVATYSAMGGAESDFAAIMTPMTALSDAITASDKSTHAVIVELCDQVTAAIPAPLSLWPE
jgi:hypothetical protein